MSNIDHLNLARQTLVVGFVGTKASEVAPFIQRIRPGGLAVLPRNVKSVTQLSDLLEGLQVVARAEGLPPLLIAVDQEGGAVARLSSAAGFTDLPSAMAVGLTGDVDAAQELAAMTGRELAAVGINLDLAPVVDLGLEHDNTVIGTRSFGPDPALVSAMAVAWVAGLRSSGVLACAKHFPGHGSTSTDSHVALPRLRATVEELEDQHFEPFRRAIAAGCAAIMTAHVVSPLDPHAPATLSRTTLSEVLRDGLGFDGLILTDALEMKALSETGIPAWEAGAQALRAGADLLVFEGDRELIDRSVASIDDALAQGQLDLDALNATGQRMAEARGAIAARARGVGPVGSPEHWSIAKRIALEGIRPVDPAGYLPVLERPMVLGTDAGRTFAASLAWRVGGLDAIGSDTSAVVVVSEDDALDDDIRGSIAQIAQAGRPVVVVVLGGWTLPADLPPSVATILAHDLPSGLYSVIADRIANSPSSVHRPWSTTDDA